jgi:D-glycero-alpha-D-manno-heptose-7-phosphate kinase
VFHIAVEPGARVDLLVSDRQTGREPVTIHAENYGDTYEHWPGSRPRGKHPLLEAAIESIGIPADAHADVRVWSDMPPGAAVGTSASVCVALIGALTRLAGAPDDRAAVVEAAHRVETEWLGQQSGIQDQIAAVHGGVNYVEIDAYPRARVQPIALKPAMRDLIQARMILVMFGRSHQSSVVHEQVIRDVTGSGVARTALDALRRSARDARDAVCAGDMDGLGAAMRRNTEAQRRLHPALISAEAQRVLETVRRHRAFGWKVNGAGGDGGSLTVLCGPDPSDRAALESALASDRSGCRIIPIRVAAEGLTVTEHDA